MGKLKSKIQIKKEEKLAREARYQAALIGAKRQEKSAFSGSKKRKDVGVLVNYIALPSRRYELRPAEAYSARSYDLGTQILGLVDHLFGRYRAPAFLYQAILNPHGFKVLYGADQAPYPTHERLRHQSWLMAALRGESVARAMAGTLNKKEAHCFLQAPNHNCIESNVFWARCLAAGLPAEGCQFVTQQFCSEEMLKLIGNRLEDLLRFYALAYPSMGRYEVREITDFVRAVLRNESFSFKGRTYGSMKKLCDEWHTTTYAGYVGEFRFWKGILGKSWEGESKGVKAYAYELTTNRALAEEGKRQRHCVFTYVWACVHDESRIVSIRFHQGDAEFSRLTIEIDPSNRTVTQIRGYANRLALEDELKVVRRWASENGLWLAR